jgi:GTPase Era involved in 16S rRNA processing
MVIKRRGRGIQMSQKRILEILKLVEFLNEEVKEVSKRLSRVTPKEVSEKLGALALLREKILNLQVELPQEIEKKLTEIYPSIDKIKPKPPSA